MVLGRHLAFVYVDLQGRFPEKLKQLVVAVAGRMKQVVGSGV